MKTWCSHTLIKNSMPFIGLVLRQVIPFANRCLITISVKSNDGTYQEIEKLQNEYPNKIFLDIEDVTSPSELTKERQKQIEQTTEDWILFLDDDDFWPEQSIKEAISHFDDDIDGMSVNPYQVIDKSYYDIKWHNKFFLKWFKNQKGLHYRYPWPRDMIFVNDKMLYWKINPRVPRVDFRYFHLSYLKNYSFRREEWAKEFAFDKPVPQSLPIKEQENIEKIFTTITS